VICHFKNEIKKFAYKICSPEESRTPLSRMKILRTNRYTTGPNRGRQKSGANIRRIFEIAKFGRIFGENYIEKKRWNEKIGVN
jgi:hypothetical protein